MNVISKIAKGRIVLFNFIGSLFQRKTLNSLSKREKLEKQFLDNIKW